MEIDNHLTTEELNRDELRVSIYRSERTRVLHRMHYVLVSSKQKQLHDGVKREQMARKLAKKLYKKFQQTAYEEAAVDHAVFLAQENIKMARLQQYTIS